MFYRFLSQTYSISWTLLFVQGLCNLKYWEHFVPRISCQTSQCCNHFLLYGLFSPLQATCQLQYWEHLAGLLLYQRLHLHVHFHLHALFSFVQVICQLHHWDCFVQYISCSISQCHRLIGFMGLDPKCSTTYP